MKKEPILVKIEDDRGKLLFAIRLVDVKVNFDKKLVSDIFNFFYKKEEDKNWATIEEKDTKTNATKAGRYDI